MAELGWGEGEALFFESGLFSLEGFVAEAGLVSGFGVHAVLVSEALLFHGDTFFVAGFRVRRFLRTGAFFFGQEFSRWLMMVLAASGSVP